MYIPVLSLYANSSRKNDKNDDEYICTFREGDVVVVVEVDVDVVCRMDVMFSICLEAFTVDNARA